MNRFVSSLLAAASIVAISGTAAFADVATPEQTVSVQIAAITNSADQAQTDLLNAEVAAQRGDWTTSAQLAEKSYAAKPDLWNEFNLATAYQNTDRGALAVPLYLDLVDRGKFVRAHPLFSNNGKWPAPMMPFIADEAAHRLDLMAIAAMVNPRIAER